MNRKDIHPLDFEENDAKDAAGGDTESLSLRAKTVADYLDEKATEQGKDPEFRKKIKTMMRKALDAPKLEKAMQLIAPYAEDKAVVAFLTRTLGQYPVLADPSGSSLGFNADFNGYAKCLRILAQSDGPEAKFFLTGLTDRLIDEGPGHLLEWLDTIVSQRPDFRHLDEIRSMIDDYYNGIAPSLAAYAWFRDAGIEWPQRRDWRIQIRFTTDGELVPPQQWVHSSTGEIVGSESALSEEEKSKRLTVILEMFAPVAHVCNDRLNTTYTIRAFDDRNMHGTWDELTHYYYGTDLDGQGYNQQTGPYTPLMLPRLLCMLEDRFGVHFVRKPASLSVSKGINRAAVERWITGHCTEIPSAPPVRQTSPEREPYDPQTGKMIDNAILNIGVSIAFPTAVPMDPRVTEALKSCTRDIYAYWREHAGDPEAREVNLATDDPITLKWLAMVDILLEHQAVCELDYKAEFQDFQMLLLEVMQGKKVFARLYDALANGTFDEDGDITEWCDQLAEMCPPCVIGYIDIDSDSYVLFPTLQIHIENNFTFSARRIGKYIGRVN